jgi:predicted nucleic acid-binding protein
VLDTTYLLPVIGISVKKISGQDVARFRSADLETAICEITTFELAAKGAKYVATDKLEAKEVSKGIEAITHDDSLIKLQVYGDENLSLAFKLRGLLSDFIDCLILATAINYADALLTEDRDIHRLKRNQRFRELIKSINSKFEIQQLSEKI